MGDAIAVQPSKTCLVQDKQGAWHLGLLTHWWRNPAGQWEGCVVAPAATGQTSAVWVPSTRLRPADGH